MDRGTFLSAMGGGVLAIPLAAEAQAERSKPRIAIFFASVPTMDLSGPNPRESGMATSTALAGTRHATFPDHPSQTRYGRPHQGDLWAWSRILPVSAPRR